MKAFIYLNNSGAYTFEFVFHFCIKHFYLPSCFMDCDIVPLIKNI